MDLPEKFWREIAKRIEEKYGKKPLEQWDEGQIRILLTDLEDTVINFCEDHEKAKRCGIPFIKGRYATETWRTISPSTFRRIFISKNSSGNETTKQQFAIYFGFDSFEEFINKHKITPNPGEIKSTPKKIPSDGNSPLIGCQYLIAFLFTATSLLIIYIFNKVEDAFIENLKITFWIILGGFLCTSIPKAFPSLFPDLYSLLFQFKKFRKEYNYGICIILVTVFILNCSQLFFYNQVEFKTTNQLIRIIEDFDSQPNDRIIGTLTSDFPLIIKLSVGEHEYILETDTPSKKEKIHRMVVSHFWNSKEIHLLKINDYE